MNQKTFEILEFKTIITMLQDLTGSNLGRALAEKLAPKTDLNSITDMLHETSEARLILDSSGTPPMYGLTDISDILGRIKTGTILDPVSLQSIGDFLRGCRKTKEFMLKRLEQVPFIGGYAHGITPLQELEAEIQRCICDGNVSSEASSNLKKIRNEMSRVRDKIRSKLQHILASPEAREFLQEPVISIKDSRQTLLVKASHKNSLPGIVLGSSGSGATLFIEPMAVHQLNNELRALEGAEQEEIYQILAGLSGATLVQLPAIEQNLEIMAQYDLAFAKGRLSRVLNGIAPTLNMDNRIHLISARHPLLTGTAVPLDFTIGEGYSSLVITGPNTGGKTVTLKTIGLLTLMAQSGLHIPAEPGTEIAVFHDILADIGDGQNITQSLSTFSAHITNIIHILDRSAACCRGRKHALALIDEIGTGTDPAEGSALAIAILEQLAEQGTVTVASTHYPEIKHYALATPGFKNGCMAFDRENLKPLYRLIIGKPGESNAVWIAEKLGMPPRVLNKAKQQLNKVYSSTQMEFDEVPPNDSPSQPAAIPDSRSNPVVEVLEPQPANGWSKPQAVTAALKVGDQVTIPYLGEHGVVCSAPDSKGRIRVLVQGKKMELPVKRVRLHIPAEQLYPTDYDLNIVLLTKEERKIKHQMGRKHVRGVSRLVSEDER